MTNAETTKPPEKLFTFASGGWVLLLSAILCGLVLLMLMWNGFHPPVGDGRNVASYGFDLSNLTIPQSQIVASGNPKDQILALPEPDKLLRQRDVELIAENEHIRFLVDSDLVIGISINGEDRAYPLRVLNKHELANDVVGKVPIGVSYSPLTGSVVVFDRRIDGEDQAAVEFGVSGLMYNSNTIYFDRRKQANQESLWPQLLLRAVSGPAAGKLWKLIPYEVTTWQKMRTAHTSTTVIPGLRTIKKEYGREPYNTYNATDELKFPVEPLWKGKKYMSLKTVITVTSTDGKSWVATKEDQAATSESPVPPYRLRVFLFAWYAQHANDTEFSAIDP